METRLREHLTPGEVEKLLAAARRTGRNGGRDEALVLLTFRHGLRVSELVALRWEQVELKAGLLHVTRRKNGTPSTHPLQGDELRALRALKRDWPDSPFLFASERGGPMTDSNVRKLIARLGQVAKLGFPVHPHQLRHACGYALVKAGHDTRRIQLWLGHRNIAHTVRYTQLSDDAFREFWRG
ncbi:MAG TPA: tyrosine-type recombinase/integrase [Steroidobacteraceae bacterium]|nr:tyrosine-type recombinase/integrase [Steroidobacteraceae bacterium]